MVRIDLVQTDAGLALRGDLTVDTVNDAFRTTPAFSGEECALDLAAVGNTDSAGVALLVYWMQEAARRNCRLRPCNAPDQMKSLIRILGLTELLAQDSPGVPGQG